MFGGAPGGEGIEARRPSTDGVGRAPAGTSRATGSRVHLELSRLEAPDVAQRPVEIVERKGLGHPDSLCDALAEALSLSLSRFYLENFGLSGGDDMGLEPRSYGVVTLHRPANVDEPEVLDVLVRQLVDASRSLKLVFPIHPRTRARLAATNLQIQLDKAPGVLVVDPMPYIPFMSLVTQARVAITDSGGIQEETTYLGIPCITLRPNTERPITVSQGTNRLARPEELGSLLSEVLAGSWSSGSRPEYWDGQTAARCVDSLRRFLVT